MQNCTACNRLQYPPEAVCPKCGKADNHEWKQVSGKGTIHSYGVVYDSPITVLQADQPYNVAIISLDEDPGVIMMSHLPGTPLDQVNIGSKVEVTFQTTPATGQKVPEWQVVG